MYKPGNRKDEDDTGKLWMRCHFAFRKTPEKVKTKRGNGIPSFFQQMPLMAHNWPLSRNEFCLGFKHCLLSGKEMMMMKKQQKMLVNLKVKCSPSAVQWEHTAHISWKLRFVFFTGSFTKWGLWRTFLGKILLESQLSDITIPHIMPGKSRLLLVMKGEREACSVNRELEPRFSGCHPDVSQYKWAHLIFPVNFILESSQWA